MPEEQQLGAPMAVVISHALWVRRFGASPSAIGKTLVSERKPLTVVGVLREGQEFPAGTDVWYPREIFEKNTSYTAHNWRVIGRVKDGVPIEQAQARPVDRRCSGCTHRSVTRRGRSTEPSSALRDQIVGNIKPLAATCCSAHRPCCCSSRARTSRTC